MHRNRLHPFSSLAMAGLLFAGAAWADCPPGVPVCGPSGPEPEQCCCEASHHVNSMPPLESDQVVCPVVRDARFMEAHINNNTGIESETHFKRGNGRDRVMVAFDLKQCRDGSGALVDVADRIVTAKLRLAAWASPGRSTFTEKGVWVGAYELDPAQWPDEGNGRWDKFFDQPATPADDGAPSNVGLERFGPGVTWNCRDDADIANGIYECAAGGWKGGDLCEVGTSYCDVAQYAGATLIDPADAISTCCHPDHKSTGAVDPNETCDPSEVPSGVGDAGTFDNVEPADCYTPGVMHFDCRWQTPSGTNYEVANLVDLAEWNVTSTVVAPAVADCLAGTAPACEVGWIIVKNQVQGYPTAGKVKYYTREGAAYWSDGEAALGFAAAAAQLGPGNGTAGDGDAYPLAAELAPKVIITLSE